MKVVSVVGARPQFVKAAAVSRVLRQRHTEILVHTGQHYDTNMSDVFFDELAIPAPEIQLRVGSGQHGAQTAAMLTQIEQALLHERPDWVLVYGDTNSTLAGALAAAKLHIPVAHVEAGLRSFNRTMPEEINRVVTDHVSTLLLCPGQTAVDNLAAEGIHRGVHVVGDVMVDALAFARTRARDRRRILSDLEIDANEFVLATVHRAENTDSTQRLRAILSALDGSPMPVVFPVHPRTREAMSRLPYVPAPHVHLINPLGYLDMIALAEVAHAIATDSGGMQKEAYWLEVPCITMRDQTEWIETVEAGWNTLTGADTQAIINALQRAVRPAKHPNLYGDGHAAERCVEILNSAGPSVAR